MSYACVIVDDEPIARDIIQQYLAETKELQVVAELSDAVDAKKFLEKNKVDILFLDIAMPGESGLEFLESLDEKPVTILTTAYRDYTLEGYDLGVMDYLVKPIKQERFNLAVQRAVEFLKLKQNGPREVDDNSSRDKLIIIKSGTKKISLSLNTITHIQGLKDYSIIHAGKNKYLVKGYIKTIESKFHPDHFIRVHRSFIVARNRIVVINNGKIEINDFQIPIGDSYRLAVDKLLTAK